MPYERIPICCDEYSPAALPQNAERLGKDAADVWDVLRDLRANNDIKRGIGLSDLGGIFHRE